MIRLLLLFALAAPLWAGKTEAQRTYWDQMMESQAHRSLYRGARMMDRGNYDKALQEFAKAVIARPNDAQAHQMLGVAYYWSGKVEKAEIEFKESLKLDPKKAQTHMLIGIVHAFKGDLEAAYRSFQKAAELDPERADIQMNIGSIEESLGLVPDALVHFRRAVELDAKHPLYHFQLGMLYRRIGRDIEAVESFKKAIRQFPAFEDATLELGAVYERMGRSREARRLFERAVKLKRRDSVARLRLARVYLREDRGKRARSVLREVFHLTPTDRNGGLALSLSYGGSPRNSPKPPSDGAGKKGSGGAQGSPEEGAQGPLDLLKKNLARIPLDQSAALDVDIAFLPRPRLVKASPNESPSSLKRALERAGKAPKGTVLGAKREFRLDATGASERSAQIRKVIRELKQVLDSAPPGAETRFGMNLSFSENPLDGGPRPGERKSKVAYQPRDVGNDLGLWVKGTGWMALIEEILTPPDKSLPDPSNADWWVVEGIGFSILGDAVRAAEAFEEALRIDPRSELAHLGRGVARVISGDEKGAVASYRRALEINPKNRAAADGLKWLKREPVADISGGEKK